MCARTVSNNYRNSSVSEASLKYCAMLRRDYTTSELTDVDVITNDTQV